MFQTAKEKLHFPTGQMHGGWKIACNNCTASGFFGFVATAAEGKFRISVSEFSRGRATCKENIYTPADATFRSLLIYFPLIFLQNESKCADIAGHTSRPVS